MKKILIATQNQNKIKEYKQILSTMGFKMVSLIDLGIKDESQEEGSTFKESSLQKARFYYDILNIPVICEDSGLKIKNLNGFPGVKSKRWMESSTYDIKVNKLLDKLNGNSSECYYVSTITYFNGKTSKSFTGKLEGKLIRPTTKHGFGYDLGFWIDEKQNTLNNLSSEFKNSISHRRKALDKLLNWLNANK